MNDEVVAPTKDDIINDLNQKLKYAQKLINNLQVKLNESNGVAIQLEAKLQLAEEDHQGMQAQLKDFGLKAEKVAPNVLADSKESPKK